MQDSVSCKVSRAGEGVLRGHVRRKFKNSVYCFLRGLLFYHHPCHGRLSQPAHETMKVILQQVVGGLLFYHHPVMGAFRSQRTVETAYLPYTKKSDLTTSRWRPPKETINAVPHFPSRRGSVLQLACSRRWRFGLVRDLLGRGRCASQFSGPLFVHELAYKAGLSYWPLTSVLIIL